MVQRGAGAGRDGRGMKRESRLRKGGEKSWRNPLMKWFEPNVLHGVFQGGEGDLLPPPGISLPPYDMNFVDHYFFSYVIHTEVRVV